MSKFKVGDRVITTNPPRSWHGTGWVQWEHELTLIPSQSDLALFNSAGGLMAMAKPVVPISFDDWSPSYSASAKEPTSKPEPNCPQCGKKAAPEHVEVASSKMSAKCRCWWCGGTWEEMLHG